MLVYFWRQVCDYLPYLVHPDYYSGSDHEMEMAWYLADITNGLMAIPNLIALIGLSGVILAENQRFLDLVQEEKMQNEKAALKIFESK